MLSCKHQNHLGTNWHEVKQRLIKCKRVEVKDPIAMCQMGLRRYYEGDYNSAFEYTPKQLNWEMWERVMNCHVCMGRGKVLRGIVSHLKEAVIAGWPGARHNLGYIEWREGSKTFHHRRQPWTCQIDRNAEIVLQKGFSLSNEDFGSSCTRLLSMRRRVLIGKQQKHSRGGELSSRPTR